MVLDLVSAQDLLYPDYVVEFEIPLNAANITVYIATAGIESRVLAFSKPYPNWGTRNGKKHYWIEDFFLTWFRRGLTMGSRQSFVREWRRMAERAFTLPQWNLATRKHLYDHQRIWWYLLGINQHLVNCWVKE